MLRCIVISMIIGALTEATARLLKLWLYGQPQTAILNIVGVFGFIMGGIAGLVPQIGAGAAFGLAAVVGMLYEIANLRLLHWWHFPAERLLFIRGHHAIVLVLTMLWGVLPVLTATVNASMRRSDVPTTIEGRLEVLNAQEKHLLEGLDAVRQRERTIQARLDRVRQKKQILLERQGMRPPRTTHEAPPSD